MKGVLLLLLVMMCCTSCSALPAEERAFAVAIYVEKEGEQWRVMGRIPTYHSEGGYMTVTGQGRSLNAALAAMETSSPMTVQLSQLRLLVLNTSLGRTSDLAGALSELSQRVDMRLPCAVAATKLPGEVLMAALEPTAGKRLSKAIDLLLESRAEQGGILLMTLADVVRMGERQTPVLIGLTVEENTISLSGGWPLNQQGQLAAFLSGEETALLSLLTGKVGDLQLSISQGDARVRDVSSHVSLSENMAAARVEVTMTATDTTMTTGALAERLAEEGRMLLGRLSAAGCDVLGLGRKAIPYAHDMAQWHALNWPERYRRIRWEVAVGVNPPA